MNKRLSAPISGHTLRNDRIHLIEMAQASCSESKLDVMLEYVAGEVRYTVNLFRHRTSDQKFVGAYVAQDGEDLRAGSLLAQGGRTADGVGIVGFTVDGGSEHILYGIYDHLSPAS